MNEEVKAFIEYANANAGEERTTREIWQGAEAILNRPLALHIPANFATPSATKTKNGLKKVLFYRIKRGTYYVMGEIPQSNERVFSIDAKSFFEEYCQNKSLRQVLLTGNYRYINNQIISASYLHLQSQSPTSNSTLENYAISFSQSDSGKMLFYIPFTKEEFDKKYAEIRKVTKTLGQRLHELKVALDLRNKNIVNRTGLNDKVVERMLSDKNSRHDLVTMVKLCAGLNLTPDISHELFKLAGVALNDSTRTNCAYQVVVNTMWGQSAEDKERFLTNMGIPKLEIYDYP